MSFWTEFNAYALEDAGYARVFKKRKPSTDHWYTVSLGSLEYHMSFLMNTQKNILAVEFAIADNKELYKQLYEKKDEIEAASGVKLDWRELPDRKMSRILYETKVDFSDRDKWAEQFAWIKEYSVKIAGAFKKHL